MTHLQIKCIIHFKFYVKAVFRKRAAMDKLAHSSLFICFNARRPVDFNPLLSHQSSSIKLESSPSCFFHLGNPPWIRHHRYVIVCFIFTLVRGVKHSLLAESGSYDEIENVKQFNWSLKMLKLQYLKACTPPKKPPDSSHTVCYLISTQFAKDTTRRALLSDSFSQFPLEGPAPVSIQALLFCEVMH